MGERTPHDSVMEASHVKTTTLYPLELRYIKALFVHQQYRPCITACRDHLKANRANAYTNPLLVTFVQFYLALAHDELARAIPSNSQAKVPAFNQAEEFYLEALLSLPTSKQCVEAHSKSSDKANSVRSYDQESVAHSRNCNSPPTNCDSPTIPRVHSPPNSPHIRNDSLRTSSPAFSSPSLTASDQDDLESHNSLSQVMTPDRVPKLQNEYPWMSLPEPQQQQVSQDSTRAIHFGNHPKLSRLSNTHPGYTLPKLDTSAMDISPVRKQLRTVSEQASPVGSPISPVSPLGPDDFLASDDDSAVSPILPNQPPADEQFDPRHPPTSQRSLDGLNGHLIGMRSQLETHIKLVKEAKQRTLDAQTGRMASRTVPPDRRKHFSSIGAAGTKDMEIQSSHSSWSLTSEDVKQSGRRRRIDTGREIGRVRMRFDPTSYQGLAERALAEL